MGLDKNGNLVIIELKKDNAARKVISQVLDYAVWAEDLTYEDLNTIAKQKHLINHHTLMEKFQEWTGDVETEFNQIQKLYVIGEKIDSRTEKLARYLRKNGIRIQCIEIDFHEQNGHKVVDKRDIVVDDNTYVRNSLGPTSELDHISKGEPHIQELYKLLKTHVLQLGDDITINPVLNYVGFVRHGKNFLAVKIRKGYLRLNLQTQDSFNDPKNLTTEHRSRENLRVVKMDEIEQLTELMNLVQQVYTSI
jgi:predicted transport protein